MKIRFIVNPISGKRPAPPAQTMTQIRAVFPKAEVLFTQGPGHATDLARQAMQNGCEAVVAVGGDGTINETAKGLVSSRTALGVIAHGSGNGFARELGALVPLPRALQNLQKNGHMVACDVGFANGELFLNLAGVGIEAAVAWQFMQQAATGRRGKWPYIKEAAKILFSYQPHPLRITVDGQTQQLQPISLVFANGRQYGSNFIIAPHANLFDGKLDMVEIKNVAKYKLATAVPFFFAGKVPPFGITTSRQIKQAVIETNGDILYHIDGEPRKTSGRLEINLVPGALRLWSTKYFTK